MVQIKEVGLSFYDFSRCPTCKGSGFFKNFETQNCGLCNGKGFLFLNNRIFEGTAEEFKERRHHEKASQESKTVKKVRKKK